MWQPCEYMEVPMVDASERPKERDGKVTNSCAIREKGKTEDKEGSVSLV